MLRGEGTRCPVMRYCPKSWAHSITYQLDWFEGALSRDGGTSAGDHIPPNENPKKSLLYSKSTCLSAESRPCNGYRIDDHDRWSTPPSTDEDAKDSASRSPSIRVKASMSNTGPRPDEAMRRPLLNTPQGWSPSRTPAHREHHPEMRIQEGSRGPRPLSLQMDSRCVRY